MARLHGIVEYIPVVRTLELPFTLSPPSGEYFQEIYISPTSADSGLLVVECERRLEYDIEALYHMERCCTPVIGTVWKRRYIATGAEVKFSWKLEPPNPYMSAPRFYVKYTRVVEIRP